MASCLTIFSLICVLVTTVATIVAFATPNWIEFEQNGNGDKLCMCNSCDCGLWLSCSGGVSGDFDNCVWFFSRDFLVERNLPVWYKAVQGLMSVAIASSLLSLIIGLFALCCSCKSCNPFHVVAAFMNLTFLLLASSVCTFGAKAHMDHEAMVIAEQGRTDLPLFGWSFWVAVGASVMALISGCLCFCAARKETLDFD